jgi:hypothetical protein
VLEEDVEARVAAAVGLLEYFFDQVDDLFCEGFYI